MLYEKQGNQLIFKFNPEKNQDDIEIFLYYYLNKINLGTSNIDIYTAKLILTNNLIEAVKEFSYNSGKEIDINLSDLYYQNGKVNIILNINNTLVELSI